MRRPSDNGAMQEVQLSRSVSLPSLITRSVHEFVKDNMVAGSIADESGSGPPPKGSIKAGSWPADPAPIRAGRRRSSVVFAPFMVNPKVQQEVLPIPKPIQVEKRLNIKSMLLPPIPIRRDPPVSSQRQRQRRRRRLGNPALTGQTGSSSYIALWVDEPQSLLSRAKHFESNHQGPNRTSFRRSKRQIPFSFPCGFRKRKGMSYFFSPGCGGE